MIIGINPIQLTVAKNEYSLFLLGVVYGRGTGIINRSLGFSLHKERKPDRNTWVLSLVFYPLLKNIVVKTILDDYYIKCSLCGGLVWKNNFYCHGCHDEIYPEEAAFVYRNPEKYNLEIEELKTKGYNVLIIKNKK